MTDQLPPDHWGKRPPQPFRVVEPQADRGPGSWSHSADAVPLPPSPPPDPTDTEYVANNMDRLRYLDLKGIAKAIMADKKVETPAELADLMAEWAAANKTKVA